MFKVVYHCFLHVYCFVHKNPGNCRAVILCLTDSPKTYIGNTVRTSMTRHGHVQSLPELTTFYNRPKRASLGVCFVYVQNNHRESASCCFLCSYMYIWVSNEIVQSMCFSRGTYQNDEIFTQHVLLISL